MHTRAPWRRLVLLVSIMAAAAAAGTTGAIASPPSGLFAITEHARAHTDFPGTLDTPLGTDAFASTYELAPGASSGWQELGGDGVLAVTAGTVTVQAAKGCALTEYPAGEAAVLPAGRYAVRNGGDGPATVFAVVTGLRKGSPQPLIARPTKAPGCASADAHLVPERPTGIALAGAARGGVVPGGAYGHSAHTTGASAVPVTAGKDMFAVTYRLEPGFASGWANHLPGLVIVTKGSTTYIEEHDGRCVEAGRFRAGQAYVHVGRHNHMLVVGDEAFEGVFVFFDLPPGGNSRVPVVGNTLDAADFTPLPPAGCPRLR